MPAPGSPRRSAQVAGRRRAFHFPQTSSVPVARGRPIFFERYFRGREKTHQVRGITCPVFSALAGIAFGKGMPQDVDNLISRHLPDPIPDGMVEATT